MDAEIIYKALMDLKQEQGYIKGKVEDIYNEAKKTNGRVTKLEAASTDQKVNWAKVTTIGGLVLFLFSMISDVLVDVVKKLILNR